MTPDSHHTPETPGTAAPSPAPVNDGVSPRDTYLARLETARAEAALWSGRERILSHLRLAVFVLSLAVGWLAFGRHQIESIWFGPPVVAFIGLLVAHDRVIRLRRRADRRADRTVDFFSRGIARIDDLWAGTGNRGEPHRDPQHPYADDLDVFGEGSLFELIATTRTAAGEALLASWLLAPGEPETIRDASGLWPNSRPGSICAATFHCSARMSARRSRPTP